MATPIQSAEAPILAVPDAGTHLKIRTSRTMFSVLQRERQVLKSRDPWIETPRAVGNTVGMHWGYLGERSSWAKCRNDIGRYD
jgi:hypothetical protein